MKSILLLLSLTLQINLSLSQINLEHVYTNDPPDRFVKLGLSGLKYVGLHTNIQNQSYDYFVLYNPDHSVFKTISIPQITNLKAAKISFISETLFDLDTLIEYIVDYSGSPMVVRICNENGTVLLQVDTASTGSQSALPDFGFTNPVIFPNGLNSKLAITKGNYNGTFLNAVEIFTLPGQLPCLECDNGLITGMAQPMPSEVKKEQALAYPNPFSDDLKIKYVLPDKYSKASIRIYNVSGELIKTVVINNHFEDILISNDDLKQGAYFFQVIADDKIIASDKIIKVEGSK